MKVKDKKKNKLSVIGIGKLGLCFSLTLENVGYHVLGHDIRKEYVDDINHKIFNSFEPGVNEKLLNSTRFIATTDLDKTVEHADIIFVTVASYSELDGSYDTLQVDTVVESLRCLGKQEETKHLIICTNVDPGYSDTVLERLKEFNWEVSFNPETVAQGTILKNQAEPDCIYIGADTPELALQIEEIYQRMCVNKPEIYKMDRLSAELTKISLNCFLTCKISFANMVGDLANRIGANVENVLAAIGGDSRINNKFFKYGFGWGGPCFPRDTRAFIRLAKNFDMYYNMCEAAQSINKKHLEFQVKQYIESGRKDYFTDYITYKQGTNILEESQQLEFAKKLANLGISVTIEEAEEVAEELKKIYGGLFKIRSKNGVIDNG
jgi:nucleotide sugar dehydrogenase